MRLQPLFGSPVLGPLRSLWLNRCGLSAGDLFSLGRSPALAGLQTLQGSFDLEASDAAGGDVPAGLILLDEPEPQTGTLQLYQDVADFG